MMHNGFHLVRAVFFALLVLFNFMTLSFSAWSLNVSSSTQSPTSSTAIFIIFESCTLFICITLGLLESFKPKARTSVILVECAWAVTLSFFQLGAAISATINGPSFFCRSASVDESLCASVSLLVPAVWLKSVMTFTYFFTLFITVLAHRSTVMNIWGETVYTVDWFEAGSGIQLQQGDSFWEKSHSRFGSREDLKWGRSQKELYSNVDFDTNVTAPWAQAPLKRGVDTPYPVTSTRNTPQTTPAGSMDFRSKPLPPISSFRLSTPRITLSPSRFIEKFRESRILARLETPTQYGKHYIKNDVEGRFPAGVVDHDMPIPQPHGCQWVRADALRSPV